jgi:hypothetical protein
VVEVGEEARVGGLAAPDNRLPFTEIARAALQELQASATILGVPES